MKKSIVIALFCAVFFACEKTEIKSSSAASKNTKEALARLGAVKSWKISTITANGKLVFDNGIAMDPNYTEIAEWIEFNIPESKMQVKYPDITESSFFKYTIDEATQTFLVREIGENNEELEAEVMKIKSGSVYSDSFILEATYDDETDIIKLVPLK
jgi:hypothetical protein